jgi:hypothetical protein
MNKNKNPNLIVCASVANMGDRILLSKLNEVFEINEIKFLFWGWRRTNKKVVKNYPISHLWAGGGFSSKKLFFHYPIWIFMVFLHSFTLSKKDIVFAVSLDVALPIYLGSLFKGYTFIFNNPDNFSLTYNLKGFLKWFIDKIEAKVAKKALYHILPIDSRFEQDHDNIVIFPNFPLDSEIDKAKKVYASGKLNSFNLDTIRDDDRFKIYINGRMVFHRGSEWIAEVLGELDQDKFLIIVAGDIYCDKLKYRLEQLDNVISFSKLDNHKALSLYYCSDLVFAFYDPILPINRKAAPNKWWDCVACQVPFISNTEIETLSVFKEKDACFLVPYRDSKKLIELLNSLTFDRNKLLKVKKNLKSFEIHSWEAKMNQLLQTINEMATTRP